MHAGVDRRCRIDQLPLYVSFQLCRVCFLRGLAFSQLLSVFSKVDVFLDKGLNLQESLLVSWGRWRPCGSSCRWRRLSVSTAFDRFINAAVRAWIGQRPFFL